MEGSELVLCDGLHPRPRTPDIEEAKTSYSHEVALSISILQKLFWMPDRKEIERVSFLKAYLILRWG